MHFSRHATLLSSPVESGSLTPSKFKPVDEMNDSGDKLGRSAGSVNRLLVRGTRPDFTADDTGTKDTGVTFWSEITH